MAYRVLPMPFVQSRAWIPVVIAGLVVLLVAPVAAAPDDTLGSQAVPGQLIPGIPGQPSAALMALDTDRAWAQVDATMAQQRRAVADKTALDKHYQEQLAEIDRLKRQRPSWRRDRQLRERMSESHGTAQKLAALDQRVRSFDARLERDRRALVAAIDRELAAGPVPGRKALVAGWRRTMQRALARGAKKIVIPDDTLDPLADPEELEYQASLLRQSEEQLAHELDRLDKQARRYQRMAELREKRSRATELAGLDDDQPRRTTAHRGGERASSAEPEADQAPTAPPGGPPAPPDDTGGNEIEDPMFDVVLADVVDASTIRALRAAEGSSDPAVKARAADKARQEVKDRLERLQKRRALIQSRAKSLRGER